jgi:hypothetical protein
MTFDPDRGHGSNGNGSDSDIEAALDELDEAYRKAAIPTNDRSPVPDGKYQARVERCCLEMDNQGTPRLKWELVIVVGPQAKRHLFRTVPLLPDWMGTMKSDLARAGATPPETLRGVKALVDSGQLLDVVLEVQAKTSTKNGKTYQNIYINGHGGRPPAETSRGNGDGARPAARDDGPPPPDDGDLPF